MRISPAATRNTWAFRLMIACWRRGLAEDPIHRVGAERRFLPAHKARAGVIPPSSPSNGGTIAVAVLPMV